MHGPIVVGTDGSDTARTAVSQTAELAAKLGATVHVVSATYRSEGGPQADGPGKKALADAALTMSRLGVPYETHVVHGEPADALIELAEEQEASLIVVGNKGMGGARRYLLGDIPNKISHHAPCNVLILRTTDPSERGTVMLAGLAAASVAAVGAGEMIRLWRRGSADAGRESMDVAVQGYKSGTPRELRAVQRDRPRPEAHPPLRAGDTARLRHRGNGDHLEEPAHSGAHVAALRGRRGPDPR